MHVACSLAVLALISTTVTLTSAAVPRECVDPNALLVDSEEIANELRSLNPVSIDRLIKPLQCACKDGYRLDSNYRLCVQDTCKSHCGQSDCALDSNDPFETSPICDCPPGFIGIHHPEGFRCTSTLQLSALHDPINAFEFENPLIAKQLGCDHLYRLHSKTDSGDDIKYVHRCACWPGYQLKEDERTCEPIESFVCENPACNERQVCVISPDNNQPTCRCRLGFEGADCSTSFCKIPDSSNVTAMRFEHFKMSVSSVCHTHKCEQDETSGEAKCVCPFGINEPNEQGFCQMRRVCQPDSVEVNQCRARNAFCVPTGNVVGYECKCADSMEFGDGPDAACEPRPTAPQEVIRRRLTQTDEFGCLPGLVDRRKYTDNNGQEVLCEPAAVTFDLRLLVLPDLRNEKVFRQVFQDAIDVGHFYRCLFWQSVDPQQCVQYKRQTVEHNVRHVAPSGLWRRKMYELFRKGFRLALTGSCAADHVHIHDYEMDETDPFAAMRSWKWLHLQVSCSESTDEYRVRQVLRARLQDDKVNGLLYLQDTAFIDPDTV